MDLSEISKRQDLLKIWTNFAGSNTYSSPEAKMGHVYIDAKSDIWSLGIILYEFYYGEKKTEELA